MCHHWLPFTRMVRLRWERLGRVALCSAAVLILCVIVPGVGTAQYAPDDHPIAVDIPAVVLQQVPFAVTVHTDSVRSDTIAVHVQGQRFRAAFDGRSARVEGIRVKKGVVRVEVRDAGVVRAKATSRAIPGWLSLLPPVLAIGMALALRQVIPSLFAGVWVGAWTVAGFSFEGLGVGLLRTIDRFVLDAVANPDHAAIVVFSLMIGGMVGIISRSGGMQGIVNSVVGFARNARNAQLATSLLGVLIFFDDYANTLVVGNTMRPVTDRLSISREKLAYLVDSTAAPVACIGLVTTWIGYEVGLISAIMGQLEGLEASAYGLFLQSIPYSFYPILALVFVFSVILTGRDFGSMYEAEKRARTTGEVVRPDSELREGEQEERVFRPKPGQPARAYNAIIPIVTLLGMVLVGLYVTGTGEQLSSIIGSADAYRALLWGSLLGVLVAGVLAVSQRILTVQETVDAWAGGVKSMLFAVIILVLAWALSGVTEVVHTADYLVSAIGDAIPPAVLPTLIGLIAALTAFSTGSSWGTMGILVPLVIPLVWSSLQAEGMTDPAAYGPVLYSSIAVVLGGAVWGDHCSPISDTTILSSMASGCDHIDHVRTQLPYALLVGVASLLLGTLPAGYGIPWWLGLSVAAVLLVGILYTFGTKVESASDSGVDLAK